MDPLLEKEIFEAAWEISDLEKRTQFLDERCGSDSAMRRRMDRLLILEDREADSFLAPRRLLGLAADETLPEECEVSESFVFGDYEVLDRIAVGAMGVVYRARQKNPDRVVALKMIRHLFAANESALGRFIAEAEAAASLEHPNIVPVYEVGEHEEQPFFSMRLIEGGGSKDRWESYREDHRGAVEMIQKVALAIHASHLRGIIHRDIKPGNILIDENGEPHVTDFGLAKQINDDSGLSLTGEIIGTPSFLSPEQASGGSREITTLSDIYSLGGVLYYALTGESPFKGETVLATLRKVEKGEGKPPRSLNPAIDQDLEAIVLKCMEVKPENRYRTATSLADDLENWLAGRVTRARPVSSWERLGKNLSRHPARAAAIAFGSLLLIVFAVGGPIVGLVQSELRTEAVEAKAEVEQNLYAAEMLEANRAALRDDGLVQARSLLEKWIPAEGERDLRSWEWYYTERLLQDDFEVALDEGEAKLEHVWSPDGKSLAYSDRSGQLKIWDAEKREIVRSVYLGDERADYVPLVWNPEGSRLAVTVQTGIEIFDRNLKSIRKKEGIHEQTIIAVSWSSDGNRIVTADATRAIRVWDADTLESSAEFEGEMKHVHRVAWSPTESRILVSDLGELVFWDVDRGTNTVAKFDGHTKGAAWSPDGKFVAAWAGSAKAIRILDTNSLEWVGELKGHLGRASALDWSPDGKRLASAGVEQTVFVWDIESQQLDKKFRGHEGEIAILEWSPDGRFISSGGLDYTLRLWDADRDVRAHYQRFPGSTDFAWSDDSRQLFLCRHGQTAIWNFENRELEVVVNQGEAFGATWTEEGKFRFLRDEGDGLRCFDADQLEEPLPILEKPEPWGGLISWHPDGDFFISFGRGEDGLTRLAEVFLWDCHTGERRLFGYGRGHGILEWSPGGNHIAMPVNNVDRHSEVHIYSFPNGEIVRKIPLPDPLVSSVCWSEDGTQMAIGTNKSVWLAELDRVEEMRQLMNRNRLTTGMSLSPDRSRLACVTGDGLMQVLDLVSGKPVVSVPLKVNTFAIVSWSPDGERLAVRSFGDVFVFDGTAMP